MPNSIITPHLSSHIVKHADVLRKRDLQIVNIQGENLTPTISGNILADVAGRIQIFNCDIIEGGGGAVNAIRTTFYDTSGIPVVEDPVLFRIISYGKRETGITSGFAQKNLVFPELGVKFQNGIGFICDPILGSPVITEIDAIFGYILESDISKMAF